MPKKAASSRKAVVREVRAGSFHVHTDPRGDAKLRTAFDKALQRTAKDSAGYRKK